MRDDKVPLLLEGNAHDDDSGGDSDTGKTAHPLPRLSLADVHRHNRVDDCWVVVHGAVYDVTSFLSRHPGGVAALSKAGRAGSDVSQHFDRIGHSTKAKAILETLRVGSLRQPDAPWPVVGREIDAVAAVDAEAYAVDWHGARRRAILNAHPEIAELEGANHFTVLLGIAVSVLHGWVTVQCQLWGWCSVILAAWTVGAWCKMVQFAINHDICHGTAGCLAPVSLRPWWHHALTLPSCGGETQHYYRWQHIGHHSSLGEVPEGLVQGYDPYGLDPIPTISSLDEIDGDLPSPSAIMLLLGLDPVGKDLLAMLVEPGDTLGQKVLKKALIAPIAQAVWFCSVVAFEVGLGLGFNPIFASATVAYLSLPSMLSYMKVYAPGLLNFTKKHIDLDGVAGRYFLTPLKREVLWAGCDVGLHTWLWVAVGVALLFYGIPADQVTISTVAKGLVYLTLSEMFMHGFCFHPYFGYFLGVHGSTGGGEASTEGGGVRGSTAPTASCEAKQCQPTMSTYDLLTSLSCLNLNYHVEHHDFPAVPWSRLHRVYAAAPEFYDSLEWSPGFFTTMWRWVQHGHEWSYACHEDVSWLTRFGLKPNGGQFRLDAGDTGGEWVESLTDPGVYYKSITLTPGDDTAAKGSAFLSPFSPSATTGVPKIANVRL